MKELQAVTYTIQRRLDGSPFAAVCFVSNDRSVFTLSGSGDLVRTQGVETVEMNIGPEQCRSVEEVFRDLAIKLESMNDEQLEG